jgi:hypothetical protein
MSQHELKTWRRQRTVVSLSRNFSSRVEKGMDGGCPCKKKTLPSEEVDNTAQHTARCVVAWRGVAWSPLYSSALSGLASAPTRQATASFCWWLPAINAALAATDIVLRSSFCFSRSGRSLSVWLGLWAHADWTSYKLSSVLSAKIY